MELMPLYHLNVAPCCGYCGSMMLPDRNNATLAPSIDKPLYPTFECARKSCPMHGHPIRIMPHFAAFMPKEEKE